MGAYEGFEVPYGVLGEPMGFWGALWDPMGVLGSPMGVLGHPMGVLGSLWWLGIPHGTQWGFGGALWGF